MTALTALTAMTALRTRSSSWYAPWTLATVALSAAASWAHLDPRMPGAWLVCTPESLAQGELWRLLTGPLVHATADHAVRDLGLLLILGLAFEPLVGRRFGVALLLSTVAAPLVAFLIHPELVAYFGMSGTVHAVVAAALVAEWRRAAGRPPLWIIAASLIIPAVLVLELSPGPVLFHLDLGPQIRSVPATHLVGFICGALCLVAPSACGLGALKPRSNTRASTADPRPR